MATTFNTPNFKTTFFIASLSGLLTACGGGGGGGSNSAADNTPTPATPTTPTAPVVLPANPITTPLPTPDTTTPVTPVPSTIVAQNVFETLNAKRTQCGFGALSYHTALEMAAANHANYLGHISVQNKLTYGSHTEGTVAGLVATGKDNPYYTGYMVNNRIQTDSSKGAKAQAVNYEAAMTSENLSLSTTTTTKNSVDASLASQSMLNNLLAAPYHMRGLVSPALTQIGIHYTQVEWQNPTDKDIMSVLELVSALPLGNTPPSATTLLSYPCNGVVGTEYKLTDESPNPMVGRNLQQNPIGQPIYILAPADKTISSITASLDVQGVSASHLTILTQANDPNKLLKANEAFIIPETTLLPATTYTVNYTVTYTNADSVSKRFNFTTKS